MSDEQQVEQSPLVVAQAQRDETLGREPSELAKRIACDMRHVLMVTHMPSSGGQPGTLPAEVQAEFMKAIAAYHLEEV